MRKDWPVKPRTLSRSRGTVKSPAARAFRYERGMLRQMRLVLILLLPLVAQSAWKAGTAKVSITPAQPIWMAGYDSRTKPSKGILRDIYAKALALDDGSGKIAVMVTIDLVAISPSITDPVVASAAKLGIPRERLLMNVSHTHSAPGAGEEFVFRYKDRLPPEQIAVVRDYTKGLIEKLSQVIEESVRNLAPAHISFGQGLAGLAVNRRRVANRSWPGPVDHDVPVLAVRGESNQLRAIVFGYACHNTSLSNYQINGDWAGFAMEELEKENPGALAMFVQGAGADSNPLPRRTVELSMRHGETIAASVREVLGARMKAVNGPLTVAFEFIDLPFQAPPSREELMKRLNGKDERNKRNARWLLDMLERDGKIRASYPDPLQIWRFGGGPAIIALGGELVVDYALRFKAKYGWADTWVAGYSNDVFGYVPSLRVLKEGGYEGGDALLNRPYPGPFAPEVEELIVDKVDALVRKTLRPSAN